VSTADALEKLIGTPDLCSKRWVWEQYDHVILGNTVQRPGGDAAVVRVVDGPKALALTCDVTPRYCEADPFEGVKRAFKVIAMATTSTSALGPRSPRSCGVSRLPAGCVQLRDVPALEYSIPSTTSAMPADARHWTRQALRFTGMTTISGPVTLRESLDSSIPL